MKFCACEFFREVAFPVSTQLQSFAYGHGINKIIFRYIPHSTWHVFELATHFDPKAHFAVLQDASHSRNKKIIHSKQKSITDFIVL